MEYEDYQDLIIILSFAKTKLDKNNKAHQETAKRIDEIKQKIYIEQANITCERH